MWDKYDKNGDDELDEEDVAKYVQDTVQQCKDKGLKMNG